jgi:4-carboxymuconolactone decarboxylase
MTRIAPIAPEDMTEEQKALHDRIAGQRSVGQVRGPFAVGLHAPDIGERIGDMVHHLLSDTRVPHNLKELAIIVIAREYTAHYEWFIHAVRAERVGVSESIVEAIRTRQTPDFVDEDESLVYEATLDMVRNRTLSQPLYDKVVDRLGEPATVELVALVGFYIMIAVFLCAFDVDAPEGGPAPLED